MKIIFYSYNILNLNMCLVLFFISCIFKIENSNIRSVTATKNDKNNKYVFSSTIFKNSFT